MKLVITDQNLPFCADSALLDRYKESALIVCLDGRAVTDEMNCFVSPHKSNCLGFEKYGVEGRIYKELASVSQDLNKILDAEEDILFLSDNNPCSLYPFMVIRPINERFREFPRNQNMAAFFQSVEDEWSKLLPHVLECIRKTSEWPYCYDFDKNGYVSVKARREAVSTIDIISGDMNGVLG